MDAHKLIDRPGYRLEDLPHECRLVIKELRHLRREFDKYYMRLGNFEKQGVLEWMDSYIDGIQVEYADFAGADE